MHEGVDRQQLHRGDAEIVQVLDQGRGRETAKRAAQRLVHLRMAHREAAHMHLVEDALMRRPRRRLLAAPGERRVDHHRLGHVVGAVPIVEREIRVRVAHPIAEQGIVPLDRAVQELGVGIEQELVGIEAVPGVRLVRPVDAIAIVLVRPQVGKVAVPDLVGHLRQRHPVGLLAVRVEQAQLDLGGMGREQGEVDAGTIPARAERIGQPRPEAKVRHGASAPMREIVRRGGVHDTIMGDNRRRADWFRRSLRLARQTRRASLPRSRTSSARAGRYRRHSAGIRAARSCPAPAWRAGCQPSAVSARRRFTVAWRSPASRLISAKPFQTAMTIMIVNRILLSERPSTRLPYPVALPV